MLNYLNVFLLQSGTFEVTTLSNSNKAYAELWKNSYDLLLLDMDMPDVTGLDILKNIQENNIDIETIVLTGRGGRGACRLGRKAGRDGIPDEARRQRAPSQADQHGAREQERQKIIDEEDAVSAG